MNTLRNLILKISPPTGTRAGYIPPLQMTRADSLSPIAERRLGGEVDRATRALRAVALFGLLVSIYFLTYSGVPVSGDELLMFDGAHSYLQNGTLELAYTNQWRPYATLPGNQPVIALDIEPMQVYWAAPLIWLALRIPGIGLMHAAWLLNIFVTALTAVVIYYYGLALHYRDRTAIVVALLYGLATMAWVYSKMFFREPLFGLLVFASAYGLEQWRSHLERKNRFHIGWMLLAVLALVGALLTKEAILIVVPTLLLVALPGALRRLLTWRVAIIVMALVGVMAVLRWNAIAMWLLRIDFHYLDDALAAYLISPGFSIWALSPALLVGLYGLYRLIRRNALRQSIVPLAILLSIILGYSLLRGSLWYSGTGWGPRYLLPTVPFLALWLLPAVDAMLKRRLPAWGQGLAVGLIVQSVFIQIIGVLVPIEVFTNYLYFEGVSLKRVLAPWIEGVWNLLYIQPVVAAHQSGAPSPIAWMVNNTGWIVVPLCLIAAGMAILALLWKPSARGSTRWYAGGVALAVVVMIFGGLRSYYRDQRYGADNPLLWAMLDKMDRGMRPGDVALLNSGAFLRFFMNYYKQPELIYALPDAPGEKPDLERPPEVVTTNPDERIHPFTSIMLARLAQRTASNRWWFVTEFSPFSQGRFRPNEHYLARHYFPAQEVVSDAHARLILYAPISAPPDRIPPWPVYRAEADYGPAKLVGYDMPRGITIKRGSMLPISLLWRHDGWPAGMAPFDYSINVSLISPEGAAVAQRAVPPLGTFGPMSLWVKGGYYHDNHALEVPADLPPGKYDLWVLIFDWRDGKNLPLRSAKAGQPADHIVLATITVTE